MRKPPNEQSALAVMYLAGTKARAGGRTIPRAIVDFRCEIVKVEGAEGNCMAAIHVVKGQ